ncbi:Actin-2 [Echinococcus granulosus]|uniref:Actin-2 n=1 Tax=Echinococcus granulosus TaxID=6210 RepID=W6UQL2_ECHGR|nr:Actin-2 [Echinococcus granulosus]EUB55714.1 Actin-2 [Echinococcus granulosus]
MDISSSVCKAGCAGDDAPRAVIPSIVSRPRHQFGAQALNRSNASQYCSDIFNRPSSSAGPTTGVVPNSADSVNHTLPTHESCALPRATLHFDFSGRDLTDHLDGITIGCGYNFTATKERETARDVKEKLCYVA